MINSAVRERSIDKKNSGDNLIDEVILSDDLFIGMGARQKTFVHPLDPSRCVKIAYNGNVRDVEKELRYRRICAEHLKDSLLITKYFGTIPTNLGTGYVYERVRDYNGKTSKDLGVFLKKASEENALEKVRTVLLKFKEDFWRECIVTVDRNTANFMVQELSQGVYQVRIVDNIGTPVLIPLVYYFKFAAQWKSRRVWGWWVDDMAKNFPKVVTPALVGELIAKR